MLESGDWLVPQYRGEPFFDKPVLSYWLMASAMRLLGARPEAARLVSVLATLLTLSATFWIGCQLFGRRAAAWGALVLATTPVFLAFGRLAMADMLLTLWSTLAVGLGLRALRAPGSSWPWLLLGSVLGLGFLTKGPIALLMAALPLVAAAALHGLRTVPRRRDLAAALGLFVLLGLGWFALIWLRVGAAPLAHFFLRENLARFAGQTYDGGRGPLYYVGTYAFLGLPWSLLLPISVYRLRQESSGRLLLLWLLFALLALSVSRGKLDYYLLPLYPATALLLGRWLADCEWGPLDRGWTRAGLGLLVLLCLAVPLTLLRLPMEWRPASPLPLVLAAALCGTALSWALREPRPLRVLRAVSLAAMVLATLFQGSVLPALWARQPERRVLEEVRREWQPGLRVVACQDPAHVERELLFHLRLIVTRDCDLAAAAGSSQPTLLLLHDLEDGLLERQAGLRVLGRHQFLPAKAWRFLALGQPVPLRQLVLAANGEAAHAAEER